MINYEKNKDDIIDILANDKRFAVNKQGKVCACNAMGCNDCIFYNGKDLSDCVKNRIKWLNAEYVEPPVDWSKVEVDTPVDWTKVDVDTPVLVSDNKKYWHKAYFAEYNYGHVWVWDYGRTSWTSLKNDICWYRYAKLAEKE